MSGACARARGPSRAIPHIAAPLKLPSSSPPVHSRTMRLCRRSSAVGWWSAPGPRRNAPAREQDAQREGQQLSPPSSTPGRVLLSTPPRARCGRASACKLFLALLCAIPAASAAAQRTREQARELQSCLRQGQIQPALGGVGEPTVQVTSWNASVLDDALPNLVLHELWWSRRQPLFNLTIITQLSVDRAEALFNQCTTYRGPMSAAVYLPLVQPPEQPGGDRVSLNVASLVRVRMEAEALQKLHDRVEAAGLCQLDMMLFYEVFDDRASSLLYPVNALRNFARMQARTPLLSAIDVDMLMSTTLSDVLMDPAQAAALGRDAMARVATVLPAFEPTRTGPKGRAIADQVATGSKRELASGWKEKRVQQFKAKVFQRGHAPTQYDRWLAATPHEPPYAVQYVRMFEPWFVTHWDVMPWFDVDFKGYGLNKIVYVASLNMFGFTFQVHPAVWLVHRPHGDTAVRKTVTRQASDVHKLGAELPRHALYTKVTRLFADAKRGIIAGTYRPRVDPVMTRCMKQLRWLQPTRQLTSRAVDESLLSRL